MFNGLVRFAPGSIDPARLEADLAEKWEATEDGKTWTFHLRHGVQFHGGFGELTADDVVFSLKKAGDAKTSAFSSELRPFQTIEAVDPYTVRLVLKDNVPSVLGILTNYAQGFIVSKKAVEQRGDDFKRNPIGTGPFAFASVTPNQSLELVAQRRVFPRRAEDQEDQLPLHSVRRLARSRLPERRARPELRPRRPGLGEPHQGAAAHHRRCVRAGRTGASCISTPR